MPEKDVPQYIDVPDALSRLRGNKALYRRMLALFTKSEDFESLEQAIAEEDFPRAADVAHGLKGVTGNLSLPLLFGLTSELTAQLRGGSPDPYTLERYRDALAETLRVIDTVEV